MRPEQDDGTKSSLALCFIDKICKRFGYGVLPETRESDLASSSAHGIIRHSNRRTALPFGFATISSAPTSH
jgi:hypothetical protein